MKRNVVSALVLVALALVGMTASAQDALQPGSTEGTLVAGQEVAFTLDAKAGDVFVVSLSSPDFDAYLEIVDPNGLTAASDDDSGPGRDSVTVLVATLDGTYTVTARSFDSSASGAFTLGLTDAIVPLTIGTGVPITVDTSPFTVFSLEVTEGAYTISAQSDSTVDTSLTLIDSLGIRVDSADDTNGVDPALQRIFLSAGVYYVVVSPYSDSVTGQATVLVETTVVSTLSAEPTVITFTESFREDTASFTVEAGKFYLFTVSLDIPDDVNINLSAADDSLYTFGNFSFTQGISGTFIYAPDVTGKINAEISGGYYSANETVTYTITVEEVKQ